MLFHRELKPEEEEGEIYDDNLQISIDMKLSYVDSARYEETP